MLSVTCLRSFSFSLFLNPYPPKTLHPHHNHLLLLRPISAIPPSSSSSQSFPPSPLPNQQLYQPFRPPPPQQPSLSAEAILDVLRNRLGLWHEYAPLIPLLSRHHSFTPPSIEESTGISGVEQNRLIVAAQVRDSLISSHVDPEVLSFFDIGGAELLHELRLLSAPQRAAAARRIAALRLEPRDAQELARAMKDFPRRKGDDGWAAFSAASPGDCLAFMHLRQSRECLSAVERDAVLERALAAAETDSARLRISQELERQSGSGDGVVGDDEKVGIKAPVVRMKTGEVADATSVVVLPVVREREEGAVGAVAEAPGSRVEGEFGVVVAEKGWRRWVVLPGWEPVVGLGKGGLVVSFSDGRVLPWKVNQGYMEEEILVIVDRERKEVLEDDGFYLVVNEEEERKKGVLGVVRGDKLKERGVEKSLGMVALVVRPPKEQVEDQLQDEDWE
ncbi:hypothetical protein AAC387_Pa11g0122 [Persea americana]